LLLLGLSDAGAALTLELHNVHLIDAAAT